MHLSSFQPKQLCNAELSSVQLIPLIGVSTAYLVHNTEILLGNTNGFFGKLPYVEHYSSVVAGGIAALACVGALEVGKKLSKNLARLSVGATRAAHLILGTTAAWGVNSVIEQDFSFQKADPTDVIVGSVAGLATAALTRVVRNESDSSNH